MGKLYQYLNTSLIVESKAEIGPCLWPGNYNMLINHEEIGEEFLISVIGHNVEMIVHAEEEKLGRWKPLKSW